MMDRGFIVAPCRLAQCLAGRRHRLFVPAETAVVHIDAAQLDHDVRTFGQRRDALGPFCEYLVLPSFIGSDPYDTAEVVEHHCRFGKGARQINDLGQLRMTAHRLEDEVE